MRPKAAAKSLACSGVTSVERIRSQASDTGDLNKHMSGINCQQIRFCVRVATVFEERVCALLYQESAKTNITRDGSKLVIVEYV